MALVRAEGAVTGLAPCYMVRLPCEAIGDDEAVRAAIAEHGAHRLDGAGDFRAGPDDTSRMGGMLWGGRCAMTRLLERRLARLETGGSGCVSR